MYSASLALDPFDSVDRRQFARLEERRDSRSYNVILGVTFCNSCDRLLTESSGEAFQGRMLGNVPVLDNFGNGVPVICFAFEAL